MGRIPALSPLVAREKGNEAFQQGKYNKAIMFWQGGLKSILSALCSGPEAMSDTSLSELDLTLNLNIAMAYMKKADFDAADRSVDKALARRDALPPHQVTKALYRKASAQRSMRRLPECLETLKDLLTVEPGHPAAIQMQQEVDREYHRQKQAQKKNMKKLFSAMEGQDREEQEKAAEARAEARRACGIVWTDDDVDPVAYESGKAPPCDGKDWTLSFCRTVLWSIDQLAVEGGPCMPKDAHITAWFVGASSTCELRLLQAKALMARLPGVKTLELVLIGFLGDLDPDNKRIPDPQIGSLSKTVGETIVGEDQKVTVRVIQRTLQDALEHELMPAPPGPSEIVERAAELSLDEAASVEHNSEEVPDEATPCRPASSQESSGAPTVPPSVCFIAHPQLHRYFTEFYPALSWLIQRHVPTIVIGASEPDPSWNQDEVLLKSLGANILIGKRESPYPMCLPDNPQVRKCNHIIGFLGGKAVPRDRLTKVKLELLAQDYSVR